MTKPREKTREELTAEIEEARKKMRQYENREKILRQKLSREERKERTHRLCKRGGYMENLVPELITMPDGEAETFLRLALKSAPARKFLRKRAGNGDTVSAPVGAEPCQAARHRQMKNKPDKLPVLCI